MRQDSSELLYSIPHDTWEVLSQQLVDLDRFHLISWEQALFLAMCELQALFGLTILADSSPTLFPKHVFPYTHVPINTLLNMHERCSKCLQSSLFLKLSPLQYSVLYTWIAWVFLDSQVSQYSEFAISASFPLSALKPRNSGRVVIWDNQWAELICFLSHRNCYPQMPISIALETVIFYIYLVWYCGLFAFR